MVEHLRPIGVVSLVRSFVEGLLGACLVQVTFVWRQGGGIFELRGTPVPGDRTVFAVAAGVLLVLAVIRLVQSLGVLYVQNWGRRLGLALAAVDFALPVTLPLALWALVVYRHQETLDWFRRHGEAGS